MKKHYKGGFQPEKKSRSKRGKKSAKKSKSFKRNSKSLRRVPPVYTVI